MDVEIISHSQFVHGSMISLWHKLEVFHTHLNKSTISLIKPDEWQQVIEQALTVSPATDSAVCHVSPAKCGHCHTLAALSAVIAMTLSVEGPKETWMEAAYLQPLLREDILKSMMVLFGHSCRYVRYQSRRAVAAMMKTSMMKTSSATLETGHADCIQTALQHLFSAESLSHPPLSTETLSHPPLSAENLSHRPLFAEPLHLMCALLSRQSGHTLNMAAFQSLSPLLPSLYSRCCQTAKFGSERIQPESVLASAVNSEMMQTDGPPGLALASAVNSEMMQTDGPPGLALASVVNSEMMQTDGPPGLALASVVNSEMMQTDGPPGLAGVPPLPPTETPDLAAGDADHQQAVRSGERPAPHHPIPNSVQTEGQNTAKSSAGEEGGRVQSESVSPGAAWSQCSRNSAPVQGVERGVTRGFSKGEHAHYVFLCVLQKMANLINRLEDRERKLQLMRLNETVLIQLISDHVLLTIQENGDTDSNHRRLLVERKFLDILDTVIDYATVRMQKAFACVYETIASQIVRAFFNIGFSWSFPRQCMFIGGCVDTRDIRRGGRAGLGKESGCAARVESTQVPGVEECSPALVTLVSVLLKSCATVFKAADAHSGENLIPCAALLHAMHLSLHTMFQDSGSSQSDKTRVAGGWSQSDKTRVVASPAGASAESVTRLDWLPLVCGEQDDRWLEALLCLLDIASQAQTRGQTGLDEVSCLTALLDPHWLFIQMLDVTGYDPSLLIDWLTSPETCFLAYLTRYLRLLTSQLPAFCAAAQSWDLLSAGAGVEDRCTEQDQLSAGAGVEDGCTEQDQLSAGAGGEDGCTEQDQLSAGAGVEDGCTEQDQLSAGAGVEDGCTEQDQLSAGAGVEDGCTEQDQLSAGAGVEDGYAEQDQLRAVIGVEERYTEQDQLRAVIGVEERYTEQDQLRAVSGVEERCTEQDQLSTVSRVEDCCTEQDQLRAVSGVEEHCTEQDQLRAVIGVEERCTEQDQLRAVIGVEERYTEQDQQRAVSGVEERCTEQDQLSTVSRVEDCCTEQDQLRAVSGVEEYCTEQDQLRAVIGVEERCTEQDQLRAVIGVEDHCTEQDQLCAVIGVEDHSMEQDQLRAVCGVEDDCTEQDKLPAVTGDEDCSMEQDQLPEVTGVEDCCTKQDLLSAKAGLDDRCTEPDQLPVVIGGEDCCMGQDDVLQGECGERERSPRTYQGSGKLIDFVSHGEKVGAPHLGESTTNTQYELGRVTSCVKRGTSLPEPKAMMDCGTEAAGLEIGGRSSSGSPVFSGNATGSAVTCNASNFSVSCNASNPPVSCKIVGFSVPDNGSDSLVSRNTTGTLGSFQASGSPVAGSTVGVLVSCHAGKSSSGLALLAQYDSSEGDSSADDTGGSDSDDSSADDSSDHDKEDECWENREGGSVNEPKVVCSSEEKKVIDELYEEAVSVQKEQFSDDEERLCPSLGRRTSQNTTALNSSAEKSKRRRNSHVGQRERLSSGSETPGKGERSRADCAGRVVSLLAGVRQRLQRLQRGGLLVYNARPLLALLMQCEQQYDTFTLPKQAAQTSSAPTS